MYDVLKHLLDIDYKSLLEELANEHYSEFIKKKQIGEVIKLEYLYRPVMCSFIDISIRPNVNGDEIDIFVDYECEIPEDDLFMAMKSLAEGVIDVIKKDTHYRLLAVSNSVRFHIDYHQKN
jgi:hypothetical protein